MSASEPFQQLALRFTDPVQHDYEVIRGILLADETVAERSRATGLDRATVGEKARRFVQHGMFGLVDQRTTTTQGQHHYPAVVAGYILYLKQLYPSIHDREIARIVGRKYGYRTNHHTVKHFLERHPLPVQLPLPMTGFHQFDDAYRARWTVVRMYYEGWHKQSIARCLGLSRKHVWHILQAFDRDGFAGLEDQRTRPTNSACPFSARCWRCNATTHALGASACAACSPSGRGRSRRARRRLAGRWPSTGATTAPLLLG